MSKRVNEAAAAALAGVKLAEARCNALAWALEGIRNKTSWSSESTAGRDFSTLWSVLHQERIAAYERLFMWALFDDATRLRAAELALDAFLAQRASVVGYLYPDGDCPGEWSSRTEEEFRAEIERLRKGGKL